MLSEASFLLFSVSQQQTHQSMSSRKLISGKANSTYYCLDVADEMRFRFDLEKLLLVNLSLFSKVKFLSQVQTPYFT